MADEPAPSTILVVEDEETTRLLVRTALGRSGHTVHAARTAREARVVLESQSVDLVVLDLILPDADGRHLLMEMGRGGASRPAVVVLTARGTATTRAECFAYGARAFIEKPVDVEALRSIVKGALSHNRSRHGQERGAPTELPDRSQLRETFVRRQEARNPSDLPLVVALIDTDPRGLGFDEEGRMHEEARMADRRTTECLVEAVTAEDAVGRWGVNELLVILWGRNASACVRLLERVQAALGEEGGSFVAGVHEVAADETFEDAVSWASRLANEGRMSSGSGILHTPLSRSRPPYALIVEDDPITASLVRHRLERSGFEVEHHENGLRGLDAIRRAVPDLVVLDIRLPGMDGFEILSRMKAEDATREVRTIILTGMGRESDVARAFELGADDYLVKPFSPVELTARALRLIRG